LPLQVALIVPSTKKDTNLTPSQFNDRIQKEKEWFSKRFGGDTSVRGVGSYWDGDKKALVQEDAVIVQSSTTTEKYNRFRAQIAQHIKDRRKRWQQSQILFRVEGQDFLYPKKAWADDDKGQKPIIAVG
jgi:hypothetical protein